MLAVALTALAVFTFTWFFRFNDPNGGFAGLTDDHFYYLLRGWQILYGELPFRDFVDAGAPLYFYVSAAVQLLFGRGTLSELAFSTTLIALGSALTFWLAARASGSVVLGVLGALFQILLLPRFYNYPKILVYTAAIPLLWWYADRPGRRPIIWLAAVTVVGFLLRHDHVAFVGLATVTMLLLAGHVPWRERLRHGAPVCGTVAGHGGALPGLHSAEWWSRTSTAGRQRSGPEKSARGRLSSGRVFSKIRTVMSEGAAARARRRVRPQ